MAISEVVVDPAGGQQRLHRKAYYALIVVTVLNVLNLWHRYLLVSASVVAGAAIVYQLVCCFLSGPQLRVNAHRELTS